MTKVTKVIDGDTFKTASGKSVRLANVNVPEVGERGAAKATAKLRELVGGKNIRIDPVGTSYGRVLARRGCDKPVLQFGMSNFLLGDAVKIIFAAVALSPIVKAIHLQIIGDYCCSFLGSHIGDSIPSCDMDYSRV